MNRAKLKNYAPQARRDFIQAVTDRAAYYGLTSKKTEAIIEKGDVALIAGRAFPRSVVQKRRALEDRISRHGFEQVMEMLAYTWFNRFMAIRFMEVHGYLDHGYRVLSHPEGKAIPEILEHAEHVDLPGLDRTKVIEMKLEGNKEEELYRLILIAQCNALHSAMPFLFEWINDETELLLPNNLLRYDSLIRKLVKEIDEEDWQKVEIIGWIYQFYILEKKDQVIGKVVKSEDIPAATQFFTPNWIVRYLVQNSLGRQWLATYSNSPLRQQMAYYIEPTEQTLDVQAQLKTITPESLNPEEITFLDDACGSGHILVEAYDLFKAIYQERGYRIKDIPSLILQKNLFGLEICDRAAQLAAFALMMKARADDRRIFSSSFQPNVLAIQESKGLNVNRIADHLLGNISGVSRQDIAELLELFNHGKTFGSLLRIPDELAEKLPVLSTIIKTKLQSGDMFAKKAAAAILPFVEQAKILAGKYDCVVANPPYMGGRFLNKQMKDFAEGNFPEGKSDLFAMFISRCIELASFSGDVALVTMQNWMFLPSYDVLRRQIVDKSTISSLVHIGFNSFPELNSKFALACAFVIRNLKIKDFKGTYCDVNSAPKSADKEKIFFEKLRSKAFYRMNQDEFTVMPGTVLSYWVGEGLRDVFKRSVPLEEVAKPRQGLATGENDRFLRRWYEVNLINIGFGIPSRMAAMQSDKKWFPYNKGGGYRKWYGDNEYVVNWHQDGQEIRKSFDENGKLRSRPQNTDYYFHPSITWSLIGLEFGARYCESGFIFDVGGSSAFCSDKDMFFVVIGFMCSKLASECLHASNPTLNFQIGNVAKLPWLRKEILEIQGAVNNISSECIKLSREDWDQSETSWDFSLHPLLIFHLSTVESSFLQWSSSCKTRVHRLQELEEKNNRLFIEAYGLQGELSPEVPEDQITLTQPDREENIKQLISYAIGCMVGRYSLDKPGLIYAGSGNKDFDSNQYKTFPADPDGIIPVMEGDWFHDDTCNRLIEFIDVAWPKEYLEENLRFIAESLGPNRDEQSRDTIRRYLAQSFFRDHLKTYKKRPIYWLFSSGKLRAFQCLVYLHRYNEATLSRMRTEYVIYLQGKIASRIEQLRDEIQNATSTSHRKKMEKERDTLIKQQAELQSFDEKLRHYADLRISLDLDDGVKVNYGKFGDLLAEVKTVTGGSDE
jgi:hypothetical protein